MKRVTYDDDDDEGDEARPQNLAEAKRIAAELGTTLDVLLQTPKPILAKILYKLQHPDLIAMCRVSQRLREICDIYKLHDRFHTNTLYGWNNGIIKNWMLHLDTSIVQFSFRRLDNGLVSMYTLDTQGRVLYHSQWFRDLWDNKPFIRIMPEGFSKVISIVYSSSDHVVCLSETGQVCRFWRGSETPFYVPFPSDVQVVSVKSLVHNFMALTTTGTVFTWGENERGALGREYDIDNEYNPWQLEFSEKIRQIEYGWDAEHPMGFALGESGQLYAWGNVRSGMRVSERPIALNLPAPVETFWCGWNVAVIKYQTGEFSVWNPSNPTQPMPFDVPPNTVAIMPDKNREFFVQMADGMLGHWHPNYRTDRRVHVFRIPVRLISINSDGNAFVTIPEVGPFFHHIGASCQTCGFGEPQFLAWPNLFCGRSCYERFFLK